LPGNTGFWFFLVSKGGFYNMFQNIIEAVQEIVSPITEILPPVTLLDAFRTIATDHDTVMRRVIGATEKGVPIETYEFGSGNTPVLLYAFPDPGEAVGATGSLALLQGLLQGNEYVNALDVRWHVIPCLNFDDQPNNGQELCSVHHDPNATFVDFCLPHPRAETTALLDYAKEIRPAFTFALHDEYHSGELRPAYFPVSGVLESTYCFAIRDCLMDAGYSIDLNYDHQSMGKGFFDMKDTESFSFSTFSVLAEYGLVFLCEISQKQDLMPSDIVGTQLCAGLIAASSVMIKEK
jgi:hypothetical protein